MTKRQCKGASKRNQPHPPHQPKRAELPLAIGAERVPLAEDSMERDRQRLAQLRSRQEQHEREALAKQQAEPVLIRPRR